MSLLSVDLLLAARTGKWTGPVSFFLSFVLLAIPDSLDRLVQKDAGDGPSGVGRQIGGLRRGPLVPLCAQSEPVDLSREKIVQNENDRLRTAFQVELDFTILAAKVEPK